MKFLLMEQETDNLILTVFWITVWIQEVAKDILSFHSKAILEMLDPGVGMDSLSPLANLLQCVVPWHLNLAQNRTKNRNKVLGVIINTKITPGMEQTINKVEVMVSKIMIEIN